MIYGPCTVCGRRVDTHDPYVVALEVTGWEVLRAQGGANHIMDRARTGKAAHHACLQDRARRERRGIAEGQLTL